MDETSATPNEDQAEHWNNDGSTNWILQEQHHDRMLETYRDLLLAAAVIGSTERVVDIGCGTGPTTLAAARAATGGDVLGLDIAEPMLERARQLAAAEGLANVTFERGDAQVHPFPPGGRDVAISRFGIMFFADPVAAFANIASGLRPGGRLVAVCWQDVTENDWVMIPGAAVAEHIETDLPTDTDGPGPFTFADRARLAGVLTAAGLVDVGIESVESPVRMGDDPADAVAFLQATGLGRAILGEAGGDTLEKVTASMIAAVTPFASPEGVHLGSKAWLVSAATPL